MVWGLKQIIMSRNLVGIGERVDVELRSKILLSDKEEWRWCGVWSILSWVGEEIFALICLLSICQAAWWNSVSWDGVKKILGFILGSATYRIVLLLLSRKILGVVGSATNRIVLSLLSCSYWLYRVDSWRENEWRWCGGWSKYMRGWGNIL